jgi:LysM repeat protein
MPTSGGDQKATLTDLDSHTSLEVQFNPSQLQLGDSARWRPQNNTTRPSLSYESGDPSTLRLELWFDATRGGGDVEADHLRPLKALLQAQVRAGGGRPPSRPPYVQFAWAGFRFVGVVTRLDVQYVMFRPDGTPVRAKAMLTLTEHAGDDVGAEAQATTAVAPTTPRVVQVAPGQTLADVARRHGTTTAELARANGVDDPLAVEPGTPLVVPRSAEMADALERSARARVQAAWGGFGDGAHDALADRAPLAGKP